MNGSEPPITIDLRPAAGELRFRRLVAMLLWLAFARLDLVLAAALLPVLLWLIEPRNSGKRSGWKKLIWLPEGGVLLLDAHGMYGPALLGDEQRLMGQFAVLCVRQRNRSHRFVVFRSDQPEMFRCLSQRLLAGQWRRHTLSGNSRRQVQ